MEDHKHSSLSKRIFATLIDYIVVLTFFFLYIIKFGEPNENGSYTIYGLQNLIPLGFWFIYLIVFESIFEASIGHYILGLKVIKCDGGRIDLIDSILRHIIDPIDFLPIGIPAIICIENTPLHQRLGDLCAKTIVVKDVN